MKIYVLSDLHLEFAPMEYVDTASDVVVVAGDIDLKLKGLRWIEENIQEKPVLYVLGNHEFYGGAHPRLVEKSKAAVKGTNIHVM